MNNGTVAKSSLSGIDSIRGTILDPNNKNGVWEDAPLTEVRLKPNTDLKEAVVREIAKGDFDKVWAILQQSHNIIIDICSSRTLECVVDALAKLNRGIDALTIRAVGGHIPKGIAVANLLQEYFGAEIQKNEIKPFIIYGTKTSCLETTIKFAARSKSEVKAYEPPADSNFIDFPIYHLLLDYWLSQAGKLKIRKYTGSSLVTVEENNGTIGCRIDITKESDDFDDIKGAFLRCGLLFPANCQEINRKLSEFDDVILGIDTNILRNCTISEHLLPYLSLIEPRQYVHTPNWVLLVIPSTVMHELEEIANVRDKNGFLAKVGRLGFRALQEIIEINHYIDIAGVSLFIVGEANPVLDTQVELKGLKAEVEGLRDDFAGLKGFKDELKELREAFNKTDKVDNKKVEDSQETEVDKEIETKLYHSKKTSSGDMIIRDQFKNFLRQLNFHKGAFFVTADKSNTALARAEGLHPLYVQPPSFTSYTSFVGAPKIGDPDKEIKIGVPIGKLIYEMAVQFGIIEIRDEKDNKITLQCDNKGDSLDHWIYRQLQISKPEFDIILKYYKGKLSLQPIAKTWNKLIKKFIGLEEI